MLPSPIGLAEGISSDGKGIDGLLDCLLTQADKTKGSVLIGPCCPDRKAPAKTMQSSLKIDLENLTVDNSW